VRRFRAQLVLLFAALLVAHAQCVLACAVDECRQASLPPCHRQHHHTSNCSQDHFVSTQAPVMKLTPSAVTAIPAADVAIAFSPSAFTPGPTLSPPQPDSVLLLTPLRI
jgi:hypothetical protein